MKKKAFTLIELLVVLAIIAIVAGIVFGTITGVGGANDKVIEILQNEGYHDIKIEGYRPMAGSDDDFHKIGFTAVNAAGNVVHGVVTGDSFKGWTIRRY